MHGSTTAYVWSVDITKKVTEVKFVYKNLVLRDIWFTLADGTTAKTCNCNTSMCLNEKTITLAGNLIGLATKPFNGNALYDLNVLNPDLSLWVDSADQCAECSHLILSFTSSIADKTYFVSNPSVTTEAFASSTSGTNLIVNCSTPTYTFTYKKNGTTIVSSPTWLTFNSVL